jgi:ribonucleoside-triphosphate reductase
MILAKARKEGKDFYEVLDYYMELIRKLHLKTIDYFGNKVASTNPMMFMQGGCLGGHLKADEKIKDLLKPMTVSFGIVGLNELQQLYNGKSIIEDGQFALEVMEYINKKEEQFKKEDGVLYATYATPGEQLCSLQVTQFRDMFGDVEGVTDHAYMSNSFHCGVWENITPIQKQDYERRFWDLFNGGKIQYCRYPIDYNAKAQKTIVRRAMRYGFYEGCNLELCYCEDCGHEQVEMKVCPKCGSTNLTIIDRMNGLTNGAM